MSLGAGIFLFVVGAIVYFALPGVDGGGIVNVPMIGLILMIAGAVGVILGIVLMMRRRSSVTTAHSAVDPASGERVTRRATETDV